jgi:hypothetical protein
VTDPGSRLRRFRPAVPDRAPLVMVAVLLAVLLASVAVACSVVRIPSREPVPLPSASAL